MIQFKIKAHSGAVTIEFTCEACGRVNIRCFGVHIRREIHKKTCWSCYKDQPPLLDLVFSQTDRLQHYFSNTNTNTSETPIISGIY